MYMSYCTYLICIKYIQNLYIINGIVMHFYPIGIKQLQLYSISIGQKSDRSMHDCTYSISIRQKWNSLHCYPISIRQKSDRSTHDCSYPISIRQKWNSWHCYPISIQQKSDRSTHLPNYPISLQYKLNSYHFYQIYIRQNKKLFNFYSI